MRTAVWPPSNRPSGKNNGVTPEDTPDEYCDPGSTEIVADGASGIPGSRNALKVICLALLRAVRLRTGLGITPPLQTIENDRIEAATSASRDLPKDPEKISMPRRGRLRSR